jgi:uracil-DNA glycosylase
MIKIGNDWDILLKDEFASDYYKQLRRFLKEEYGSRTIYPDMYHIFDALKLTPPENVKVVILGQDPYHGPNQAHGLAFSVQKDVAVPPSLQNIYTELSADIHCPRQTTGDLTPWAKQGVLLLNTCLTVRAGAANSHSGKGWERLTDAIIRRCNELDHPVVFLLWGSPARAKKVMITNPQHLILEAPHPSPLSAYRGFFGCRHFSNANAFLEAHGEAPINWDLTTA